MDPRRHERVFGLRVTNRAPHLLLDWRQYPHKTCNLFSVCEWNSVSSDSLSSYEQPKIGRPDMAKKSFVTSAQNVVQDQAGKIVDMAKAGVILNLSLINLVTISRVHNAKTNFICSGFFCVTVSKIHFNARPSSFGGRPTRTNPSAAAGSYFKVRARRVLGARRNQCHASTLANG